MSGGRNPDAGIQPDTGERHEVTRLLRAWSGGDGEAFDRLWPLVYTDLRRRAAAMLRSERRDHTLQATALVHEAYLRLVDQRRVSWQDRQHFFAIAARMMRRILVDHARAHASAKRGGGRTPVSLDEAAGVVPVDRDLLGIDAVLEELEGFDPDKARIVELRFFAGLNHREIAELLGCSTKTIQRHWVVAKAWLYRALSGRLAHGA